MPADVLRERDGVVESLNRCLAHGGFALATVPGLVRRVVSEGAWRERIIMRTGQRAAFTSFEAFVQAKPLEGLGSTIAQLKNCCRDDVAALNAIDEALQRSHGGNRVAESKSDNIPLVKQARGTSLEGALRRLRKERPDLHRQVLAEQKSAHAAMIEAGFRHRTATVPIDDVDALVDTLQRLLGKRWTTFKLALARQRKGR